MFQFQELSKSVLVLWWQINSIQFQQAEKWAELVVCIWRHENIILGIMINLPQIFISPIKPYNASLYQIWSYFDKWKQSYGPKKLENFLLYHMGKWAAGNSFAHQHGYHNINVWRFSELLTAVTLAFMGISTWNLQRYFKMQLLTLFKNFVTKVVYLNFWWRHCKPRIGLLWAVVHPCIFN